MPDRDDVPTLDLSELSDEVNVLRELTDRTGEAWAEIEQRVAALAGSLAAASAIGSPSPPVDQAALAWLLRDMQELRLPSEERAALLREGDDESIGKANVDFLLENLSARLADALGLDARPHRPAS